MNRNDQLNMIIRIIIITLTVLLLSSCRDEEVDLKEYIIPQSLNGQVRAVAGMVVLNKELVEDSVQIIEYDNQKITTDTYDLYTPKGMKEFNTAKKMNLLSHYELIYFIKDNIFRVAVSHPSRHERYAFSFPQKVKLNKTYDDKSVGTLLAATPTFNREIKLFDTFRLTQLEQKDCLIHTRKEEYVFRGEKKNERTDFIYCKPYGYVQKNIYKKDGTYIEFIKLRKLEEL